MVTTLLKFKPIDVKITSLLGTGSSDDVKLHESLKYLSDSVLTVTQFIQNLQTQIDNVGKQLNIIQISRQTGNQQKSAPFNISFSDPLIISLIKGNIQKVIATGDISASSIIGTPSIGDTLMFYYFQDATGGHVFSWPPNIVGGIQGVIGMGPNQRTKALLQWDGSAWEFVYVPAII